MKANLKALVFLFSIVLNVVFAGAYAVHKLPLGGEERRDDSPGKPLFLELDLSTGQRAQLMGERDKFHAGLQELGKEIRGKQVELIGLLALDNPDRRSIEGKRTEIRDLQTAVQDRVIAHLLQESAFLSPEQRARFFRLLRERMERSVPFLPPWAKPLEAGRAGENGK
jgi:Spy/CpxP family protein refolding chaperone